MACWWLCFRACWMRSGSKRMLGTINTISSPCSMSSLYTTWQYCRQLYACVSSTFGTGGHLRLHNFCFRLYFAFVAEPLLVWLDIYQPIGWRHIYSVPGYFFIAILLRWLMTLLTKEESISVELWYNTTRRSCSYVQHRPYAVGIVPGGANAVILRPLPPFRK